MVLRTWPERFDPGSSGPQSLSPAEFAQKIRGAVERGASGLIVEPENDPAVHAALYEAVERGVAVLSLDQPVAPPSGGKPIPYITYASFAEPGRQIVQAVLEAGKLLRQGRGRIIVLHNGSGDVYGTRWLESLTNPLREAGKSFELVAFSADSAAAPSALYKSLGADPDVAIVLADDYVGLNAAYSLLPEWRGANRPEYLFGGYLAYDYRSANELLRQATAFGDRAIEAFAVKVFQTMQSLIEGKPVSDRIEIPIIVHKKTKFFVPTTTTEAAPSSK
jgi:ABC-type sugar transport system substrate-binding protein